MSIAENEALPIWQPESDDAEEPDEPIIQVSIERQTPVKESAGRCFPATEFPEGISLFRRFGGGGYVIKGRNARGKIVKAAVRYFSFAGPSRPMNEEPGATPAPASMPAAPVERAGLDPNVQALMMIMEKASQRSEQQAMLMLQTMMESSKASAMAMAESSKQTTQMVVSMMTTFVPLLTSRGAPADTAAVYRDGMNDARALFEGLMEGQKEAAAEGGDGMASTINAVTAGVDALARLEAAKAQRPPAPANGTAPNGNGATATKSG